MIDTRLINCQWLVQTLLARTTTTTTTMTTTTMTTTRFTSRLEHNLDTLLSSQQQKQEQPINGLVNGLFLQQQFSEHVLTPPSDAFHFYRDLEKLNSLKMVLGAKQFQVLIE